MCGIAGEVVVGGRQPDRAAIARVLERMKYRGPDGNRIHAGPDFVLGHLRLTIIDLTDNSAQPFIDAESGCVITYNGELYNYIELREELVRRGHRFRTTGDTEVLLKAYVEWGAAALARFNGMFAFAIFDPRKRQLFAARDPAGQKPLLYHRHKGGLIFASELAALLKHPAAPRALDPEAICHYFVYEGFANAQTIVAGVNRLPPGSHLTFDLDSGALDVQRYWQPKIEHDGHFSAEPSARDLDQIEATLRDAVARHLRSDVPVGIYLSGGVDSNLIATLACDRLDPREVRTFTVRHTDPTFDEADEAKWTAEKLGTRHHEMTLTLDTILDSVPRILDTLDEPLADPGLISIYQVARFASQHVKVVLSGDGGDEFFCGYAPFHRWRLSERLAALPAWTTRGVLKTAVDCLPAQYGYMGPFYKAQTFARGFGVPQMIRNMAWIGAFTPHELRDLLTGADGLAALREHDGIAQVYDPVAQVHDAAKNLPAVERLSLEYQSIYLPACICAHSDKANMMHSLEARSPLLDPEIMTLANRLPLSWKLRGARGKWILRRYLEKRLGPSVGRRKKRGFTVPIANWLRGPLRGMAENLLSPDALSANPFLNAGEVQRLWREHQDGRRNHYKKLWAIVVLQAWQQRTLGLG